LKAPRLSQHPTVQAAWVLSASALMFSAMGLFVRLASAHYTLGELLMYRGLVGMVMVFLAARFTGVPLATSRPRQHLMRSVYGVSSLALWFHAIAALPLSTAIALNYTSSLWTAAGVVALAWLLGRGEGPKKALLATVAVGFVGVLCVLQPSLGEGQMVAGLIGVASGALSAMVYFQVAALARLGEPDTRIVFYFSVGTALLGLAMALLQGMNTHTPEGLALLLSIGVFATAGQWLMTRAYAQGPMLVNASLNYLGIVFSALFGWWIFNETLSTLSIVGMMLIVVTGVLAAWLQSPDEAKAINPPLNPTATNKPTP
jgi:drug/metabolite transporter (DMT)-like permease